MCLSGNNLKTMFTETYKLADIICTTPTPRRERERCFSTLNRIKTFLRNTMLQDKPNALAVLLTENYTINTRL